MKPLPTDPLDHLDAALRDLVQHERMNHPSPRLRERVMASWAAAAPDAPAGSATGLRRSRSRHRLAAGAVVAATIAAGAIGSTGRRAPSSSAFNVASTAPLATPVAPAASTPLPAPTAPTSTAMATSPTADRTTQPAGGTDGARRASRSTAAPARGERGPRRPTPAATTAAAALSATAWSTAVVPGDAFVAITPSTGPELGPVQVMRVRLGRRAARTLGVAVPVLSLRGDGSVDADVLIGTDGVARAIRFVP